MVLLIVNQILKMLIILLIGYLCYKLGLIDQHGNTTMANLLLMVVNPLVAVMSLQTDYRPELLHGLAMAYLLAILSHIIEILISQLLIRKNGNDECAIERFSCVYANCGFIGIPLIQSVMGSEGVFYLTAYMTTFNILSWTHGMALMTGTVSWKNLKQGLLSPMILASILGLALFALQIRIPDVPADALTYIANMNTPLAMLIAGVSVAQADLVGMLKNPRIYLISALKLLLIPALVLVMLLFIPVEREIAMTTLIASACPVAASGTAFALRFGKNYRYASQQYAFSTLLSLVTIPCIVFVAEHFL
jgi:hypothetical protein